MALQLKFTIDTQSSCQGIVFTDLTGSYNVSTNPTGFGSPNPAIADILANSTFLSITNNTTGVTYDNIAIIASSTSGTETLINTSQLCINSICSAAGTWPDGLYTFVYSLRIDTGGGKSTLYSQTVQTLQLCNIQCQIKTLAANVEIDCGCCNDDCSKQLQAFLEAFTLYKALQFSGACGNIDEINDNIEDLQTFLINLGCQNCG